MSRLFWDRSQDNNRHLAGGGMTLDPEEHFQTTDFGNIQIQQHDGRRLVEGAVGVRPGAEKIVQRFGAVADDPDGIGDAGLGKGAQRQFQVVRAVIHQKYFLDRTAARPWPRFARGGRFRGGGKKLGGGNLEGLGKFFDALESDIAPAPFDPGDISAMQIGAAGEFLLGNSHAESEAPDRRPKVSREVRLIHKGRGFTIRNESNNRLRVTIVHPVS